MRPRHPVLREVMVERRAVLRTMGMGTVAAALAACGGGGDGGDGQRAGGRRPERPAASVEPYDPDRPYWEQGNFAAVQEEVTETGPRGHRCDPALVERPLRPQRLEPAHRPVAALVLGDGMVHGVRIEEGRAAWYRNRWVGTTMHTAGQEFAEAGVPGRDVNQSNVALAAHAGRLLTLGEVGWPYELAPDDLATVGPWDFDGRLTTAMTAHPKIDPATGEMHFFGYGFVDPLLTYHVADTDGLLVRSEPVALEAPVMIHDFAITDRDVVFWIGLVMFGVVPGMADPSFPFH